MNDIGHRLDVRDLQVVLAVASAGSTARASQALHLTQPAVSRALLATEQKIGVALFERRARGLVLTAAGERLVAGAPTVLAALASLERGVRTEPAPRPELRIVCECYTAYRWVPSALRHLESTWPELSLSLAVGHTHDPVAGLRSGEVDVALLTTATVDDPAIDEQKLLADEVVFVLAPSHPLARHARLTAADLLTTTLLSSQAPAAEARWFMQKVFGRSRPQLRLERLPLTEALVDVARAGLGVAILSEWVAQPYLGKGDLVAKRFARKLERPWRIAYRKEVRGSAQRLRNALRSTAPRLT